MKKSTKTTKTTKTAEQVAEMYTTADKSTYLALRARHEKSGLRFLEELQNAQKNDQQVRRAPQLIIEAEALEKDLAKLREDYTDLFKTAQYIRRQSENLKNADDFRRECVNTYCTLKEQLQIKKYHIKRLTDRIADLYDKFEDNFSDCADIVQDGIVKLIELETTPAPLTASIIAEYGAEEEDELTDTERADAQSRANFQATTNVCGQSISKVATPDALNRNKTVLAKTQATEEEVNKWIELHGGYGDKFREYAQVKRCRMSECYRTLEYKDNKQKKGFYIATHYKTTALYQYIEDFSATDENGENDIAYLKTYNPLVNSFGDIEELTDFFDTLNLTDVERLILEHYARALRFTDNKAEIIATICNSTKLSRATVYRKLEHIKSELEPRAKELHIIK